MRYSAINTSSCHGENTLIFLVIMLLFQNTCPYIKTRLKQKNGGKDLHEDIPTEGPRPSYLYVMAHCSLENLKQCTKTSLRIMNCTKLDAAYH